jgi:hypothetical protein
VKGEGLPNAARAIVPERKVKGYLLSEAHPDGRGKARFFAAHGFSAESWQVLADALERHAAAHPVSDEEVTSFGMRYVVDGKLQAPDGRAPRVRSVWFIDVASDVPRLVTAYPSPRR